MFEQEIESIAGGYHGNPFAVLGPHPKTGVDEGWVVRAFLPQVKEMAVLVGSETVPAMRVHAIGVFEAEMSSQPGVYRFRVTGYDGSVGEMEDPYRFPPVLSDFDIHLTLEGTNYESYNALGAHLTTVDGVCGTRFAVWAPNAIVVSLIGDMNGWDTRQNPMRLRSGGVWEIFMPGMQAGAHYKYNVKSRYHGYSQEKADPVGFGMEVPPKSASIVVDLDRYEWHDDEWMTKRAQYRPLESPMAVYEVHLGSWQKGENSTLR